MVQQRHVERFAAEFLRRVKLGDPTAGNAVEPGGRRLHRRVGRLFFAVLILAVGHGNDRARLQLADGSCNENDFHDDVWTLGSCVPV